MLPSSQAEPMTTGKGEYAVTLRVRRARNSILGFFGVAVVFCGAVAGAETPAPCLAGGTVSLLVPHGAGGGYDTFSRLFEPYLEKHLGVEVQVVNVDGAGGAVGALRLKDAPPDGRTLGLLNGGGLMVASLSGETRAPNPARDFTILARAGRSRHVWATGKDSSLRSLADVFEAARTRPIVFGLRDVGSTSFISIVLSSNLLGLDYTLVAGYGGSREAVLAVMRGEVDLISYNYDSIQENIDAGDLRVLLQISDEPIADLEPMESAPWLGGREGVAVRRASERGEDPGAAEAQARAIAEVIGAGRILAAPPDMDPGLATCLRQTVLRALNDEAFRQAAANARFAVDAASGEEAAESMREASDRVAGSMDQIRAAIAEVRQ